MVYLQYVPYVRKIEIFTNILWLNLFKIKIINFMNFHKFTIISDSWILIFLKNVGNIYGN